MPRQLSRRTALAAGAALVALLLVGVAVAPWDDGDDGRPASAALPPPAPAADEFELPARRSRPQAVEPEAGRVGGGAGVDESAGALGAREDEGAAVGRDEPPPPDPDAKLLADMERFGARPAVDRAVALPNGVALPPLEAPAPVRAIVEAGNEIARAPYKWGGGHGKWRDKGYDCSGSVSYALAAGGLLEAPLDSGRLMKWGKPGRGKWITVYSNPGHVFLVVAGIRFDTSGARVSGSRWQRAMRGGGGFVARHPPEL